MIDDERIRVDRIFKYCVFYFHHSLLLTQNPSNRIDLRYDAYNYIPYLHSFSQNGVEQKNCCKLTPWLIGCLWYLMGFISGKTHFLWYIGTDTPKAECMVVCTEVQSMTNSEVSFP